MATDTDKLIPHVEGLRAKALQLTNALSLLQMDTVEAHMHRDASGDMAFTSLNYEAPEGANFKLLFNEVIAAVEPLAPTIVASLDAVYGEGRVSKFTLGILPGGTVRCVALLSPERVYDCASLAVLTFSEGGAHVRKAGVESVWDSHYLYGGDQWREAVENGETTFGYQPWLHNTICEAEGYPDRFLIVPHWSEAMYEDGEYWTPDEAGEEHSEFPKENWKYEVANGDTRAGYIEYVNSMIALENDQTVAGTSPFQATALVGVPIGLPA